MTHLPPPVDLVLASASARRREMLALLGLPFRSRAAQVDETPLPAELPAQTVLRLAQAKARAVADDPAALVVGCDTVVVVDGRVVGKPADAAEARAILERLRGDQHAVCSGLALRWNGREVLLGVETLVIMRDYANQDVETYIASGDPFDKAGAYGIQHPTFRPVARWQGCYANVMGLPLCHLAHALRTWGVALPANVPAACQAHTGQTCTAWTAAEDTARTEKTKSE